MIIFRVGYRKLEKKGVFSTNWIQINEFNNFKNPSFINVLMGSSIEKNTQKKNQIKWESLEHKKVYNRIFKILGY